MPLVNIERSGGDIGTGYRSRRGERRYYRCDGCFEILCTTTAAGEARLPDGWRLEPDGSTRCKPCQAIYDYRNAWREREARLHCQRVGPNRKMKP